MEDKIQNLKLELDQIRMNYRSTSGEISQQQLLEKGKLVLSVVTEAIELVFDGQVIASGGFSVEYYTEGQHATQDIDLIISNAANHKELNGLFIQLGFTKKGNREWALDDIGVFIEKVADTVFDGDHASLTVDRLFNITFVNVNDIIIDRVRGYVHWKEEKYQDQIVDLVLLNMSHVNFPYIKSKLNIEELNYWKLIEKFIGSEDSAEEKLYRFKTLLNENNIIFSESQLNDFDYIVWFPTWIDDTPIYFGLNIFDNFSHLLYNESEECYQLGQWPETLTKQWAEYLTIKELIKEVMKDE